VALFVALAPLARRLCAPGGYPASRSVEPGLSSASPQRLPGHLPGRILRLAGRPAAWNPARRGV